jgi:hypothetical protein
MCVLPRNFLQNLLVNNIFFKYLINKKYEIKHVCQYLCGHLTLSLLTFSPSHRTVSKEFKYSVEQRSNSSV